MRVMYLIDSVKFGGAEMLLLAMAQAYRPNHEISVVYFTHGPLYEDFVKEGIKIHRISKRGWKDPLVLPKLVALMRKEKPDVVHTHLSKSDLFGLMAAAIAGVPVRISSIHNVDPWRKNKFASFFMRQWTRVAQHHIAVSEKVREYVLQNSKYPAEKLTTIDNGIDLDRFNPATVIPFDRATFNIPADAPVVTKIARLEESKAHHILLETAALVAKEMPNVRFLIVGDGPLRSELEAQRDGLGLQNTVIFAGIQREIPQIMAMSDIITFSSAWEGLPVALLEAMAMGKPTVCTTVGGIPMVVQNGENGVLVPPGNPRALADGLLSVLKDKAFAAKLGENARKTIVANFSAAAMHQRILDIYNRFLKKDGSKAKDYVAQHN
jgi:glycosyltransferase involved in cell wall biosynthesis